MDEDSEKNQTGNSASENDDFNRTVVVSKPECSSAPHTDSLHKMASRFVWKKREVEDLIGGMNISHYTNSAPDVSAKLNSPLSNLDSRYSILEEFAQGGLATVSIARDKNLCRIVAIKSLKEDARQKKEIADSFVAEAKVTAQLDHPAIIPIYGLTGDEKSGIHLSMKLVNGKTLREYLRNLVLNYRIRGIKAFDEAAQLRKRLEIFLRVCDAIAYAHHRNIMHRDLKPENIMLGKYMEVYVVDWGLAKVISDGNDNIPDNAKISGTPRYLAPEVLLGEKCDARSDIFTLGLILQEIVTLQFAIKGKDEKEYMEHILGGEQEPIRHLFKWHIDKALQAIIRKATAYSVQERYQSVNELSEDLRRYMAGLSISAYPDNIFMKFSRFAYQHRQGFMAGLMALFFLFASVTVYAIYRQLQTSREMNIQNRAINFIYNRTASVSEHLNITALHIQEQLSALARLVVYLLSYHHETNEHEWEKLFRPTYHKIGKTEQSMFYSPHYKRMISLDYGIYTFAPDTDPRKGVEFIKQISPVLTKMKYIVLGSESGYSFDKKDYEKLKMKYLYKGFPVRSVYIGSRGGVKLLYPWRGNYPREVDPRERLWYRNARKQNGPAWGKPYMDFDSISGLCIPCSVPIVDLDGIFRGVVGADLSVNRLTQSILSRGNIGDYVIEKAVISREGEIIFSSKSNYFNKKFDPEKYHSNTEFKTPLFRSWDVRSRILNSNKDFGTFIVTQRGRRVIYSFAHLEIFNMFFVVVADYEKLVQHILKDNQ